jgi:hypothetical protein
MPITRASDRDSRGETGVDFELSEDQKTIRMAVAELAA